MQPIEPIDPPIDPPGGDIDPPGTLPGLGQYLRRRYTCNLAVVEQMPLIDLLNDTVMTSARMYVTQGPDGRYRMHNKKPVDFAFGTVAFPIGEDVLELDDVSPWVGNLENFLLIDPHTNKSEIREVLAAEYSADQNDVTLTTNEPTDIVITGFAGGDANTPATAEIEIDAVTAATEYTIELDGIEITFTPSTSDSPLSVSSFLTGAFKGHPKLNRRFRFDWDGISKVLITARFGTLEVDPLELAHAAPVADPTVAPTLTAVSGLLSAGTHRVCYTFKDEDGNQTLVSPSEAITLTADQAISVGAITPPADCTVCWYVEVAADFGKARFHSENNGAVFTIDTLPKLDDPLPPDLNRTGCEVMRVNAVFSDRGETRSHITRSNVIKATFEWSLSDQKKRVNRVDLAYRDASQDWRRIEMRFHDKDHQRKIKKVENKEYNGNAIDTNFQNHRIGAGMLAEHRDAFFRYKWQATREALLIEEGDVVVITDSGPGVYNLPVMVEKHDDSMPDAGLPMRTFTAHVFANTLYDDSIVERQIPIIAELDVAFTPNQDVTVGGTIVSSTTFAAKVRVEWFNTDAESLVTQTTIADSTITVG